MKFLVEILNGSSFEIEVDLKDTLLEVKQKIEKSQRIPVSKQTFIADGIVILRDDLNLEQCQIVPGSLLQLDLSYDNSPNHNGEDQMPQTEQPPAPWIPVEKYFEEQDWPLTDEEIRKIYSYGSETIQDSPVTVEDVNKNQLLHHQTEQSPVRSDSVEEIIDIQDSPVTVGSNNNDHHMLQTEQSPPSNSTKDIIISPQDSTVTVQLPQTEQSPASNSVIDITGIIDPPVNDPKKIQVSVLLLSSDSKAAKIKIRVNVNATDHVKILRNELVEFERKGYIKLPQEGYFFWKIKKVLNEDQSFEQNGVLSPVDGVLMVPRSVIYGSPVKVGGKKNNYDGQVPPTKPVKVGGKKNNYDGQVPPTKQSPQSNSVKEIQNSPVKKRKGRVPKKITVIVLPMNIQVIVKPTDEVKKLKERIQQRVHIQTMPLLDGCFLAHKQKILYEDQSFEWNGVEDGDTIGIFPVTVGSINKNQVIHQTKQSLPSNSTKHIINRPQDLNPNVPKKIRLPPKEQPPVSKDWHVNVPKKIRVLVFPHSSESEDAKKHIEVNVYSTEHVKIMRNFLAESQRIGQLNLPLELEDYYFASRHKKELNEDQSFEWNGIESPTDQVWMVPRRGC